MVKISCLYHQLKYSFKNSHLAAPLNGMKGTMCPCPDFNCASCLGLTSPMDGTDKMEVEFGDEKKERENTHQEVSKEVMQT